MQRSLRVLLVKPGLNRTSLQVLLLLVLMSAAGNPPSLLSRLAKLLPSTVGRTHSCLLPVVAAGVSLLPHLLLLNQRNDSPSRQPLLVADGNCRKHAMLHSQLQATGARRIMWASPPVKRLLGHSRPQLPTWQSWRRLL